MTRQAAWWLPLLLLAGAAAGAVAVAARGDDAEGGADSLKSALEAISRRQRDLAALGGAAPPLAHYRSPPQDLAFLAPPRDFAGDGQPENIGYGYQKSAAAAGGGGGAEAPGGGRALERLLLEYLEAGGGAPMEEKRGGGGMGPSVFRERAALREPFMRRRRPMRAQPLSSFRERAALEAFEAEKRDRPLEFARELEAEQEAEQALEERQREEAEEEEEHEREEEEEEERRQREEEEEREDEYLDLLQGLWRKYRQANPDVRRIEDLSPEDLQELLGGIADGGDLDEQLGARGGPDKRQYGGFDYFNNAGALGGWQAGGMYRKRSKQRLEQPGPAGAGAGFLYALKFASPAAQRDALEALADDDDAETGGERDEDAARLAAAVAQPVGSGGRRLTPVEWERAAAAEAAAEAAEDAFGAGAGPGPAEEYQRLLAAAAAEAPPGPVLRKRTRVAPRQRILYDGIPLRKRYPVTKRSSDFYANPPLMHRRSSAPPGAPQDERRRKKDAGDGAATDPKVANELTQIFGSELHEGESEGEGEGEGGAGASPATTAAPAPAPSSPAGGAAPPSAGPAPASAAPATASPAHAHTPRNGSRELTPDEQRASNEHHHGGGGGGGGHGPHDSVEQPLALSRAQAPLDIKKKSVDWSEYFGLDRRRKKTGPDGDERWLLDRYRNLALATTVRKRGPALGAQAQAQAEAEAEAEAEGAGEGEGQGQGPPLEAPPLDMRHFALGDIFSRASRQRQAGRGGEAGGGRLDGVDSKLRGMEDLIVNEAVKYTGAHEGATDPQEVQEVKDKILARLAAAYSLEKMRLALREFKSSLQAQKMSRYNPENQQKNNDDDKKKRVAVKKEKAEEKEHEKEEQEASSEEEEEEKKKRVAVKKAESEGVEGEATEFLDEPRGIEPLSEGYMGKVHPNAIEDECPLLVGVERKCRAVGSAAGDRAHVFLPLCTLHQICYLCGPAVGAASAAACDALFVREAALGCGEDAACALAARRSVALLRRRAAPGASSPNPHASPFGAFGLGPAPERCWPGSCLVQRFLAAPLGARAR